MLFDEEKLFLIEGTVCELQFARTTVNLLAQIEVRSKTRNLMAGTSTALSEMHRIVATSPTLGLFDAEDLFNFAALINGQVFCGVFEIANRLKNGDAITAVVSKRDELFFVHSLRRTSDHMFLMPLNTFAGKRALLQHCLRVAWAFTIAAWVFSYIVYAVLTGLQWPDKLGQIVFIMMLVVIPPLLMFPMEVMTYRTVRYYGEYASAIFKVYGFSRPNDFDTRPGIKLYIDGDDCYPAVDADLALAVHRRKYRLSE